MTKRKPKCLHLATMTLIAGLSWALAGAADGGGILFVDDDALAGGDGQSWDTAYRFLQDAMAFASDPANGVSEIRVAQGAYTPDRDEANPEGSGDRDATFFLIDGAMLRGGYAGIGADDPDAQDADLFTTVLSGDLAGDDGADFANNDENSYRILTADDLEATVVSGFEIRGGNANGKAPFDGGGGLSCTGSVLSLDECRFIENAGTFGGAIWSDLDASLDLISCDLTNNSAATNGGAWFAGDGNGSMLNCVVEGNTAEDRGGGIYSTNTFLMLDTAVFISNVSTSEGGGGHLGAGSLITNCQFFDNRSLARGAGGLCLASGEHSIEFCEFTGNQADTGTSEEGGALFVEQVSSLFLSDSTFEENSGWGGGAVSSEGPLTIQDCTFELNESLNGHGAAVAISETEATITGSSFIDNCSTRNAGAVDIVSSVVTIDDCEFRSNLALDEGGALVNGGSDLTLSGCLLRQNFSADDGGAIYISAAADKPAITTIANCEFLANESDRGGAIRCTNAGALCIEETLFESNSATFGGAVAYLDPADDASVSCVNVVFFRNSSTRGGGALDLSNLWLSFSGCLFERNSAHVGGGLALHGCHGPITNCQFLQNETVESGIAGGGAASLTSCDEMEMTDCEFIGNKSIGNSDLGGGAVFIEETDSRFINCEFVGNLFSSGKVLARGGGAIYALESSTTLINCTLAANTTEELAGGIFADEADFQLTNCILWANSDAKGGDQLAQVFPQGDSTIAVGYSCVQGWTGDLGGLGNIGADPLFQDIDGEDRVLGTADDNVRLSPGSPCADAAFNGAVPTDAADVDEDGDLSEYLPLDLDGNPRFADDPLSRDAGCGVPVIVDMGAYESPGEAIQPRLGDIDGDLDVDTIDLILLLGEWGDSEGCSIADVDGSFDVDVTDLILLLGNWG